MKIIRLAFSRGFTPLALLLGVLLSEAALRMWAPQTLGHARRVMHPDFGEVPVPGRQGFIDIPGVFKFHYTNNSRGLRGPREFNDLQPFRHRILAIGDSFTYGIGVNDDQTWSARLEKLINKPEVAVINAGNEGTGTDYALRFFSLHASTYQPQECLLFFHFSDFENNLNSPIYTTNALGQLSLKPIKINYFKQLLATHSLYNWLTTHSHLVSLIKFALLDWAHPPVSQAFGGAAFPSLDQPLPSNVIQQTRLYLQKLQSLTLSHHTQLKVFYTPSQEDFLACREGKKTNRQQAFELIAKELKLDYVLLTDPLSCAGFSLADLYLPDGHWTPMGHAIAASLVRANMAFPTSDEVASTW